MTEKELKHLKSDCEYFLNGRGEINLYNFVENLRTTYIEPKENRIAELKLKLEALEGQTPWKDIKDKSELIKENTKLKEESKKIFNDWLNACDKYGKVNLKLTKAKEIIREVMNWYWENDICSDSMSSELRQKAEQFLQENE